MNDSCKINMKLKREKDDMNSWEIKEFLDKLANTAYKYEIMNEIGVRIKNGLKPENIIIISKSFDFNQKYKSIKNKNRLNLNKEVDVKHIYHLGEPISFFPNDTIYTINFVFKIFRKTNELLRKYKCGRLSKNLLCEYSKMKTHDVTLKIYNDAMINLKVYLNDKVEIDKHNKIIENFHNDLSSIKKAYNTKIENYSKDKVNFDNILSLNYMNLSKEDKEKYFKIENRYFKAFSRLFDKLDRPVVCIYDDNSEDIEILCLNYICKDIEGEKNLDIKEISHNSPMFFHVILAGSMIVGAYAIVKSIDVNNKNNKMRNEVNKTKEDHKKKINEIVNKLDDLKNDQPISNINNMENSYFKDIMKETESKLEHKTILNVKNSGLDNNNIVIDFEKYRLNKSSILNDDKLKNYSKEEIYNIFSNENIKNITISELLYKLEGKDEECYSVKIEHVDILNRVKEERFYIGSKSLNIYDHYDYKLLSSILR